MARADAHRCSECGTPLDPQGSLGPAAAPSSERPSTPDVTVGSGSERRLMTVMFCDMVGSSRLASGLDPEDFAALLLAYRERCSASVFKHGGHVVSYAGDGVLACFGYPRAVGRDARAAVACGLDIAREVEKLAGAPDLPGSTDLAVRVGIETGLVVAGRLGAGRAMELDGLVGVALHIASRLQEIAPRNGVVIGSTTQELVGADFHCEEVPRERLARVPAPARAFLVLRARELPQREILGGQARAPLVDRATELATLRACWSTACARRGQTVLIAGEPGIGKSRLVQELISIAAAGPHELVALVCTPQTTATALHPAIEALRRAVQRHSSTGDLTPDALVAWTAALGLPAEHALPILSEALGLGPGPRELGPETRRRLLVQRLEDWLLHCSVAAPLLVVAEDLQWADPSSLEFLRSLGELVPERRIMLVGTQRSDVAWVWPERPGTLHLQLTALERSDAELLLQALVLDLPAGVQEAIIHRAEGVPLFLEEFALASGGRTLPRTLQELFTARLDGLGPAKKLAQRAAVFGSEIETDLLAAIAEVPEPVIHENLAQLVASEVLVPAGPDAQASYTFRHAVLQEAAYDSLLLADRKRLHAQVASLFQARRGQLTELRPELLAHHYVMAGEPAAAVAFFIRAVRRALGASALEEGEAQARRALAIAEELPPEERVKAKVELLILLGQVLIARRGYASSTVQETLEEALAIAGDTPEEARLLPLLRGLTSFYQVRGPLSKASGLCARLVASAERSGDACMLADAWRREAWNRFCLGEIGPAQEAFARVLGFCDGERLAEHISVAGHDPRVLCLANLCWLAMVRRGRRAAARWALEAVAAAQQSPHLVSACYGLVLAAAALQLGGRWDEARDLAQRALATARDKGIIYWDALSEALLGYDDVQRGEVARGIAGLENGLARYNDTEGRLLRPFLLMLLAQAHRTAGALQLAQTALREALDVARTLEAPIFAPGLAFHLARMLTEPEQAHERRDLLATAVTLARRQGACAVARLAERELRRLPPAAAAC